MIQVFMCLLVLGPSIYSVTEGCGRVPATPAPTTVPTPTERPINGSVRQFQCYPEEENKTKCLNQGTCFVLILQGERRPACHCTKWYYGERCQNLNSDVIFSSTGRDQFAKAGIAASIAVLIVIVIVFVGVALVYYRKHRRRRRDRMDKKPRSGVNGSLLPENHIQPPNPNMHPYARNGISNNCNSFEEKKPLQIQYQITSV